MPSDSSASLAEPAARLTPAVRMGLSIAFATGLYGISFGALAVAAGLSVAQAMVLSLLMFTGGSQFAFIGVVAGGGSGAAALSAATLLGVRNAVYGMQIKSLLGLAGWRAWLGAHITIDESTATAAAQQALAEQRRGFWVAGLGVLLLWNAFTLLGALLGDALGDPRRFGLDGAAVAAFMGLLWPRLRQREPVALALACGLLVATTVPLLAPGLPVVLAAALGAAWGWWRGGVLARQRARGGKEGA